ncbi:hypothetical protein BD413DRAFT_446713, partial [Trametes elegans]
GTVCCVHETLATPIELILRDSPGIKEDPKLRKACVDALNFIYNRQDSSHPRGKKRPCVLTSSVRAVQGGRTSGSAGLERPVICVMGTFGGTPMERLSKVYQHFAIPVFSNKGPQPDSADGLANVAQHTREAATKQLHYWLDEEGLAWLYTECDERIGTWSTKCTTYAGFARDCEQEYR